MKIVNEAVHLGVKPSADRKFERELDRRNGSAMSVFGALKGMYFNVVS